MKFTALISVFVFSTSLIFCIVYFGLFTGLDAVFSDRFFNEKPINERIVIIGIDERSLNELGQWPFPRALMARGLKEIISASPARIGIDILYSEKSRLGEEDDDALKDVLTNSSVPIILPIEALSLKIKEVEIPRAGESVTTRTDFLNGNIFLGHINLIKDRDGVVRRFPHKIDFGDNIYGNFSSLVVNTKTRNIVDTIVWSGAPRTIEHISFADIVNRKYNAQRLKDAYIFIGATATDLHDEQTTPVSEGSAMSGVEIQAQIGNMLLSQFSLREVSTPVSLIWFFTLIIIPIISFFYLKRISTAIFTSIFLLIAIDVTIAYFFEKGIEISVVHTSLAIIVSSLTALSARYYFIEREKKEIKGVFSKYVSKAVLDELLRDPKKVSLGGSEAEVTVFFSDIRGFTTLSEKLTPRELTQLLNLYLTRMTDVILKDNGVVDKYIGDAIMAFWGAPLPSKTHSRDAIKSSLTMLEELDRFNEESARKGRLPINIGIGLNTGQVIVGNMGSSQRFDYTIMGDAVNLGSRIEGQTKSYGVRFLVSEYTIASYLALGTHDDDIVFRELDKVTVKGKKQPVALFEIVEKKKIDFIKKIADNFEKLRESYYKGDWHTVLNHGSKISEVGEDSATILLVKRAEYFIEHPPLQWTGVYELTSK